MCIAYELNGKKIDYLPTAVDDQLKVKPIYKTFEGWKSSTKELKFDNLPQKAELLLISLKICRRKSLAFQQAQRKDTILIKNPFNSRK